MSVLTLRSDLARAIREYFHKAGVAEVTTALLRSAGTSDVHLDNLTVELPEGAAYLQTSPEFAMKILLAEYQQDIYQVCPAFRGGEIGHRHRREFQMLEWYRWGFKLPALMDDVAELLNFVISELAPFHELVLTETAVKRVSYRALFESRYRVNPHQVHEHVLRDLAHKAGLSHLDARASRADLLDGLFSTGIEAGLTAPTFVYDYPACQSALAETKKTSAGDPVSDRFELFVGGLELANAYQELIDADELVKRMQDNNRLRSETGKAVVADDPDLIAATGRLSTCSGIALGVDRLAMVLTGRSSIEEVAL